MTDLTEQWKKGKLEEYKTYYCKTKWFEDVFKARCYNKDTEDEWWALENEKYKYNNIYHTKDIEVLAPVPSYEEWDKLNNACHELEKETACLTVDNVNLKKWCEEFNALEVAKENAQLKSKLQLKETAYDFDTARLEEQNAQLKELLKECREYVKKDYGDYLTYTQSAIYQEINQALGEDK